MPNAIVKNVCITVLLLKWLLKILNKKKQIRRWWVKPHLKDEIRYHFGSYHTVFIYFKLNDHEEFYEFVGLNLDQYSTLYELMKPKFKKKLTNFRIPLHPELRLTFILWILRHGGNVKQAALMFHMGVSTAYNLIENVCKDLIQILRPQYIQMPTRNKWIEIANSFQSLWNFPNCIGALDGKHIYIEKPVSSGSYFWSYKKRHSFVLMAIADAYKRFIWYSIGDFGSINDAAIFSATDFAQQLMNNELDIPPPRPLPNTDIEVPFMLIADEIFGLKNNLMKPFSKSIHLTLKEKVYNYRLKRPRLCIECAFGILVEKFQILQKPLNFKLKTSYLIVSATICLHNFLITTNTDNNFNNNGNRDAPDYNIQIEQQQNLQMTPIQQRQLLTSYFCSDAGSVDWQYAYI